MISTEFAGNIWDILVEDCGAINVEREGFIHAAKTTKNLEYRFCGNLGFGGKIYLETPPRISCYSEDRTKEKDEIIQKTNRKLSEIYEATQAENSF